MDENSHKNKNQRLEKIHKEISWGRAIFWGAFFLGFLEPGILHEDNYFHFKPT